MSNLTPQVLAAILRKFEARATLDAADREAFLSLPFRQQTVEANIYLVREGDRPDRSCVILEGFVVRHKMTESGKRQIISMHMAGDFIDLEGALLNVADHNAQTTTRCEVAFIARSHIQDLIISRPRIGMAMWVDTLID
ncbi:MAG: cyclic nucleotide-binding domain-containing protein, partial [Cohnella sp.]|nr:cyclic nucleotide-binding domain-containing protein [Cohnella sp.]